VFDPDQYELIDFGAGRKLERFGPHVVDRPAPAAEDVQPGHPTVWESAEARYERTDADRGRWLPEGAIPRMWTIRHGPITFELKPTEFGHLGVFVEQASCWDWIARQVKRAGGLISVLNLFAYTGGSTLAAAAAGADVCHVDSSKTTVAWARRNADRTGLADAPIRWIVEDAVKFVRRELRRGRRYDAVILDPPSYGHGPKGEIWKLSKDLMPLLSACAELTEGRRAFMLLTCHTAGFGPAELEACLADALFGHCQAGVTAKPLSINTADGRKLPSGVLARWPG